MGCRIILLIYVDNILLIFHLNYKNDTLHLANAIHLHFEFHFKGEGDVFIGIKILYDWANQSIYLNNSDYIYKIVVWFHQEDHYALTPAIKAYLPYNDNTSNNNIHLYQQIIGSLNYVIIII